MEKFISENIDKITEIRGFNRFYTNIFEILEKDLYGSGYSLSEVRILFEISKTESCTAAQLCSTLKIDRGYMSRILHKFEQNHLITRSEDTADSRTIKIQLTEAGSQLFHKLDGRSNRQIANILQKLTADEQLELVNAMKTVKKCLTKATANITIRPYKNSDISYVIDRQLSLYEAERHFTSEVWKAYLRQGVTELLKRFDQQKDCMLILEYNHNPAGCVAITHADDTTAQFRYFFVEPELRGIGAGRRLLEGALSFCREKEYRHIFLWTVSAQETARGLYKRSGFTITESHENNEWGVPVLEEKWEREL